MLSKLEFCECIEVLKRAEEMDLAIFNATNGAFNLLDLEPFHHLGDTIVRLLELAMGADSDSDVGSDIVYFVYELDFGKNWTPDCYTDENGDSVDISTAEKLYNVLVKNAKTKNLES